MDKEATWYGGKRRLRRCARWGRSSPKMGTAPSFWFMSSVAKWLDG